MRQAAWIARCVGRGEGAPLRPGDLASLADVLRTRTVARDTVMFAGGQRHVGVWIVRAGRVELSVGSGRRRVVVHLLQPGDVDGDIQLLLDMPMPYTARALTDTTCLHLADADFDALLRRSPTLARRWMSSIAMRPATSQNRILGLLGKLLTEQVAQLLLDKSEHDDGVVVVDAPPTLGHEFLGGNIRKAMREISHKPITHVVCSHHQRDHIGAAKCSPTNAWLVFDTYLNAVAEKVTDEVVPRWIGTLAGVDMSTRSHAW